MAESYSNKNIKEVKSEMRGEPLQELKLMQEKMSRRLDLEGEGGADEAETEGWQPLADIYEDSVAYVVRLELPGLDQSQIEVSIEEESLVVRGERRLVPEADVIFRRIESNYGPFIRTFALPEVVDQGGIKATCERGLLQVVLPKRQAAGVRHIEIEVRQA